MQTFLPFPDFGLSACCLDDQRLGKQRLEALTIYTTLRDHREIYAEHPAVKMWKGYLGALAWYYNVILSTWKHRGFKNTMEFLPLGFPTIIFPPWLGNREFHRSHQSNLLRKDENHYRIWFGTTVPKNMDYYWPIK